MDYKTLNDHSVLRTADGAVIPFDDKNADYIAYQAWLADGGVPQLQDIGTAVPASVTRRQFKRALLELRLLDSADALVAASNDRAAQIDWADALDFRRDHPLMLQFAAELGKTAAEIDACFVLAKTFD